jgi:hypothetical protein
VTTSAVVQPSLLPFEMTAIPTPDHSLSSKAMLCSVSIPVWPARKYDPEVSDQIAELHNAQRDAGRYNKLLVPKQALQEINKIAGEARQDHYFLTLPWSDEGSRVLPAATYLEHAEKMRHHRARFEPAVNSFVSNFEELVTEQSKEHSRLGTMFNIADYPGMRQENGQLILAYPQELRAKFSFDTDVKPLPDASDFRVALGDEDVQRIKRQIEASLAASLQVGTRELWQRLYKVVRHMSDRLTEYNATEEGKRRKLYDSWVTNIVEIVDVLPKLNITRDMELERMAADVRASLLVDPNELRKSEIARSDTAKAAAQIAARMAAYMGVPPTGASGTV